jgi:hypothetical protein
MDVGFLCFDEQGKKVDKPSTCKVTVVAESYYKGSLYVTADSDWCTWSTWLPGLQENKVQFGGTEEATFDVNGKTIFAKSARFQRGNQLSTTRESAIEAKVGTSAKDGAAADIGVKFGKSVSESQSFDTAETFVVGTGRSDPFELNDSISIVTLKLTAGASVFSNSESRVWGQALANADVGSMWYYGKATGGCGDQQTVEGYDFWSIGTADGNANAWGQAKSFFRANGINFQ